MQRVSLRELWNEVLPMVVLLAVATAATPVQAGVTIRGKVEYWDRLAGVYKPAQGVHVEVEGDWWWMSDPDVLTDDQGRYQAVVADPPWWWGHYDGVDIEAYAERGGQSQVFESMVSLYPYHVISRVVDNVGSGQVVEIDVKIGGPQNNAAEVYYRTFDETANAFLVQQEILSQYRRLRDLGFPEDDFDEADVIVPAYPPTGVSYYDNWTEFINLSLGDPSGTGDWTNLPTGGDYYITGLNDFRATVRHEYGHAIHDELTGACHLLGFWPAYHNPEMETNPLLAYTEGFATFMPLATLGLEHRFEVTPSNLSPPALTLNIPTPASPGGHDSWEGEVTSVLLDLIDPVGREVPRYAAARTVDGVAVPDQVVRSQFWQDRISDPSLRQVRKAVREWSPTPAQTIGMLLWVYRAQNPQSLHAIKAIAYNRSITSNMPAEKPAALTGKMTVTSSPVGRGSLLKATLQESDVEDRPFIGLQVWHQNPRQAPSLVYEGSTGTTWSGSSLPLSLQLRTPSPQIGAVLWVVVNDEILPTAYRLEFNSDRLEQELPRLSGVVELPRGRIPVGAGTAPGRAIGRPSAEQALAIQAFRSQIRPLCRLLRDFGDRQEVALRGERSLAKLTQAVGSVRRPAGVPGDLRPGQVAPGRPPRPSPAQHRAANAPYQQGRDRIVAGATPVTPLSDDKRPLVVATLQAVERRTQAEKAALARLDEMIRRFEAAHRALPVLPSSEQNRRNATALFEAARARARELAASRGSLATLERQAAVLRRILGTGDGT